MKGYVLTLCAVALFVTITSMLLPEGNIKKYATLVSSLMISLSILMPLKGLFKDDFFLSLDDIEYSKMTREDAEGIYKETLKEEYKNAIEEKLSVYGRAYVTVDEELNIELIEIYIDEPVSAETELKIKEEYNPERLEIRYGEN